MNATKRTGNAGMADDSGSVRVIVKGSGLKADSAHAARTVTKAAGTNGSLYTAAKIKVCD
ncbi:hypothetical protein ACFV00_26515 [Streptomyces californicus]|uniref:hypothetical protein n=1 Tax=Streptomyces californicus TaxID=67351 RepID=UPI0036AEA5AF